MLALFLIMKEKYLFTIIKNNKTKAVLCNDNKLRDWLFDGNSKVCFKKYKRIGNAMNKALKLGLDSFSLIHIYTNDNIKKRVYEN